MKEMKHFGLSFILVLSAVTLATAQETPDEPPYGMEELEAYSVFVDAYRTDDYEMARMFGEWMVEAAPREIEGYDGFSLERHFGRMINVYVESAEATTDPTEKTEFLERAEEVFEKTFAVFSEDEIDFFDWNIRQGRFYHENIEHLDADMNDAAEHYEQSYEIDPQRFAEEADGFYASVLLAQYAAEGEREKAFSMIDEIESMASPELAELIDDVRDSLLDNPEERIDFFESRLAEADEDAEREEILENLVELYTQVSQTDRAAETSLELFELNPTFTNAKTIADSYLSEGNYSDALDYQEQALELAEDDSQAKEMALEIAETHQQLNNLEAARDYTRNALELDSNWGEAFMRMSSIYASAISECTDGDALGREDRAVYWLVADYLERAKEADSSLASTADNRLESYTAAMPSAEDKFFSDWEDGQSFEIDETLNPCYGWINETTTVR